MCADFERLEFRFNEAANAMTLCNNAILLTELLLDRLHPVSPDLSTLSYQLSRESRPIASLCRNYSDWDAMQRIVRKRSQSFMDHVY